MEYVKNAEKSWVRLIFPGVHEVRARVCVCACRVLGGKGRRSNEAIGAHQRERRLAKIYKLLLTIQKKRKQNKTIATEHLKL